MRWWDARPGGSAALVLILAACGGGAGIAPTPTPSGPATLTVGIGAVNPGHPEDELLAIYPTVLSAHPGDTLRLQNPAPEVPHTVTFGVLPDRSNQPPLLDPGKGFTPISAGPCVSAQPVSSTTASCPGAPPGAAAPPAGTPPPEVSLPAPFSGQPFYNSGILLGGQTATLQLSPSLKPGPYRFICLLHPTMAATLTVVARGTPIQSVAALTRAANRQLAADLADAAATAARVPLTSGGAVQAGEVGRELSVNQFFPGTVTVSAGQTVTWRDASYEPHLVVFGRHLTPDDPLVFGPPTVPAGADYAGGDAVSGFFGGKPFPADSYALRFTTPGSYSYICAIHPGMAGVVQVT